MGLGDELMGAGAARVHFERTGRRVRYWHKGKPKWFDVWDGLPWLVPPDETASSVDDWVTRPSGLRPYIAAKNEHRWIWKAYQPQPSAFVFTDAELAWRERARGCVLIEPNIKPGASPNKQWSPRRWQQLVDIAPDVPWLQVGVPWSERLRGVRFIFTENFRQAAAALSVCAAAVLPEGGLHHAAAAVGTPAVVIFGGYIGPSVTGYPQHRSLFVDDGAHPLGCGMRLACPHCSGTMAVITPEQVLGELKGILHEASRRSVAA